MGPVNNNKEQFSPDMFTISSNTLSHIKIDHYMYKAPKAYTEKKEGKLGRILKSQKYICKKVNRGS